MNRQTDIRKLSLVMVTVIATVAVLLPLCMMIQCGMTPTEMLGSGDLGLSGACAGTMADFAQAAVEPGSPTALMLLLTAVFGGMSVLMASRRDLGSVWAVAETPPSMPQDPRGVRLLI